MIQVQLLVVLLLLQSSLLQSVLGELRPFNGMGSIEVSGRVSYASQVPWVFSGSLKENILFGSQFNRERYDKVINACALRQVSLMHVPLDGMPVPLSRSVCL